MRRIGHSLLRTASAIALLAGVSMLAPSEASAQVNPFGMLLNGRFPPPGGVRRGKVHETKHERHSKQAKDEDTDKNEHSDKQEHSADEGNRGNQGNHAEDKATTSTTPSESGSAKPAANTNQSKPVADVPSFTPER